jgi:hypothetical protein
MRRYLLVAVLTGLLLGLLAVPALAASTITVYPAGKTADMKYNADTFNIRNAFKAAMAAGRGSTVQLAAGHFYMNNILVKGIDGHFKGAGRRDTVVDCLRGLNPALPGCVRLPGDAYSSFIVFEGGHPRVSDMTFDITAKDLCEIWDGATFVEYCIWIRNGASSTIDRVSFKSWFDKSRDFSLLGGITISDASGVHTVTRCSFDVFAGLDILNLTGAKVTVGGTATTGNAFHSDWCNIDCGGHTDSDVVISHNRMCLSAGTPDSGSWDNIFSVDNRATDVEVSCNTMRSLGWENISFWQPLADDPAAPPPAARVVIGGNTMVNPQYTLQDVTATGAGGVWLMDEARCGTDAPSRLDAVVADNAIVLDNGGFYGGIEGFGTKDTIVTNNRVSGTAVAAIMVGAGPSLWDWEGPSGGSCWQIVGNDVSGLQAVPDGGRPPAQIWLGQWSNHCKVIGGCTLTTVLDEGTHNVLKNVTELTWTPSAATSSLTAPAASAVRQRALRSLTKRY